MGPLKGRPAWNEVKPANNLANMIATDKPSKWAGSAYVPSTVEAAKPEQAGGMKSDKSNAAINGANVKKSKQTPPPADPNAHMLRDGGKY